MKIVHVVRQYFPSVGGLQDFVTSLVAEQLKSGYEVEVFTLNTDFQSGKKLEEVCEISGVKIRRFKWFGSKRYPICFFPLKDLNSFDVVHVHAVDFFVDYFSLMRRLGLLKKKLILTTHGGYFHTEKLKVLKSIFFRSVTPFTTSKVDRIVCCSVNDYDLFERISPKVDLVDNGVSFQKFGPVELSGGKDLICFGRFSENKRVDKLIRWFGSSSYSGGVLKVVGRSGSGNTNVVEKAIDLYGNGKVELLLDLTDEAIRKVISGCRYVVSASEYEGFGLGVIELMSYGLIPLLSKNPKSFCKFVQDSGVGKTFDDSVSSLEEAISWCEMNFSNANVVQSIKFSERFAWKSVSDSYSEIYTRKTAKKILAVSSSGGHWVQLNRLSHLFDNHLMVYASTDRSLRGGKERFYFLRDANMWDRLGMLVLAFQTLLLVAKVRPDVIITTGAAPGYFSIMWGKFFRCKTIWIDSIANVDQLSKAGQSAKLWADIWLTQWEHLAKEGGPDFRGAVL